MTKTLFIGLDGATFTVLDSLVDSAHEHGVAMPFLKHVMENGARAKLRSTANPLTPPAWVSIMTGRTPGNHGVYDFLTAKETDGEVFFTLSDARDIRTETIWSIASRQDQTIAALNFPITAPPRKVNGSIVPGFVPWKHLRRNTAPQGLFDRLKEMEGFEPRELAWDFDQETKAMDVLDHDETENWVRYHLPREEQWFRIAEKLLSEDSPDLMAVMFDGTDKIQHQAWQFLDPALAGTDTSDWGKRMVKLCREYFQSLDGYIERLVKAAGPDTQVFFASDHGFTASTEVVRINSLLHEMGYLKWREIRDDSPEEIRRNKSWFANLDWPNTTAYCRTPSSNGINIRVSDNPDVPGVRPEDYEEFRNKLIADLESVRDPATGERIIREIHRREDVFAGDAMADAPDLLLTLRDFGFVSISNVQPSVEQREVPVGTHHPDGVFIAYGKGIKAGVEVERQDIVDVPANLLYSVGLEVPSDFEGSVSQSMYTEEHLQQKPVKIGAKTLAVKDGDVQSGADISDDEKEKIIEQLKMLGYMG